MNVKRYTARTSREALALVRQALGDDAVVLSTRPGADGVEVLAMAPDGLQQIEHAAARSSVVRAPRSLAAPAQPPRAAAPAAARGAESSLGQRIAARGERSEPRTEFHGDEAAATALPGSAETSIESDVETLGMSTLTFQDYVRERMLKRRQAELDQQAAPSPARPGAEPLPARPAAPPQAARGRAEAPAAAARLATPTHPAQAADAQAARRVAALRREPPVLRDEIQFGDSELDAPRALNAQRERSDMLGELRSVRSLIEERFGMLAFMEKLQRDPRQAALSQKLFDAGLSPALVRKLVQSLPADAADETAWAAGVLERNLLTDEHEAALEDHSGVFALIGPTGVGKTTSTAKIAAAFATKHGAANLGLITLDAYRVAAHEQLRTYGRILGVPVHTAHDRASLEDLLELLAGKKLVLIDTAGMAQRDSRTRELLDMLSHPAIQKILVVNAAAQGETVEDVMLSYRATACRGVIVSKLDEAVKLGPALDALIRHKSKVVGVTNGQRVPEDWHRLSAQALVQRALRGGGGSAWRLDAAEVNLVFAATHAGTMPGLLHA
jgi:flagellar biosynthesis protein FlhF